MFTNFSKLTFVFVIIMSGFSVVSLNAQGCRDSFKRYFVLDSLKSKLNADIVFLQDTHTIPSEEGVWKMIWRGEILFSHLSSNTAGLAFCFSNNLSYQILEHRVIFPGRILHATVKIQDQTFHLINVYSPTCPKEKLDFLKYLKQHLNSLDSSTPVLLGGDFNCTTNPSLDRTGNNEPHPHSSNEFKHILKCFKLIDTFRNIHPYDRTFSWARSDGVAARLDRIYISKHFSQFIQSAEIKPCSYSDHDYVRLFLKEKKIKGKSAYWCLNTSLLDDKSYIDLIKDFWVDWRTQKNSFENIQDWWDCGKYKIKEISQEYSIKKNSAFKNKFESVKADIEYLKLNVKLDSSLQSLLVDKQHQLSELERVQARGAWVRSRFQYINDSDKPTKYFFDLEKKRGTKKLLSHLTLPDGSITDRNMK